MGAPAFRATQAQFQGQSFLSAGGDTVLFCADTYILRKIFFQSDDPVLPGLAAAAADKGAGIADAAALSAAEYPVRDLRGAVCLLPGALFADRGGRPFLGTLFVLYVVAGGRVSGEVYGPEIYRMGIFRVAGDRYLYFYRLFGE